VAPDVAVSRDTSEPALAAADPDALNTPTVAPGLASRLAVAPAAESAQAEVAAIVVGDAAGDALTASAGPGERAGVESMPVGPSQPIDVEAEAATLDFAAADVVPVAAEAREPDMPSLDFSMPLPVASAATEAPAQGLGTDIPLATTGEASPAQHAEGMTPDGDAAAPDGHPAAPDAHDALSLDFSMPLPSPLVSAVPEAHAEPAAAETPLVEEVVRIGTLELSPTLFNVFVVEAQAHLATLAEEALALASGEPASQRLQRAAHTLAGIAGTVHIDALRELGHALELAVGRLGAARVPAAVAAIVSESVAELDRMAAAARDLRVPAHVPELVARLDAIEGEEGVAISDATSEVDATTAPDAASSTATAQAQAADSAAAATPAAIAMASGQPAESENAPASVPVDAALAATGHVPTTPAVPGTGGAESQVIVDSMPTDRRERRIHDDLDRELLPIFLEEAAELVPAVGQALRDWRAHPDHPAIGHALQRSLHTLKGSARMCGAMSLGELTHAMESRIENALALSALPMALLDELEASYDRMSLLHDRLLDPDAEPLPEPAPTARADAEAANGVDPAAPSAATAPVTPVPPATAVDAGTRAAEPASPTSAATSTERPAPREATAPPPEAGDGAARAMLRVRAEMIDRLVNEAGEIAIARSRIDGEMRALKGALGDLTENVTRLRGQLREVEIQAESQMASRLTVAQERDTSFDPLEFDRFTRFQELTRMMAESVNDVQTVHQNIIKALDESDAALSAQARLNRELQQSLMRIRMVPFQSVAERLYRVVRQAAKDLDKRAVLDIRGAQVELDRSVLERITAPFEHLLRNSVAHGIEKPADRVAAGKKELGEIRIELRQEGNEVMMAATDDGAGIDLDRVRAKAVAQGLIAPDAQLSDKETADLVFHSGFSTATEVSQIAGRGVGMDVVKSEVQALGGRVEIATQRGKGARFTIYLPLTLAVTQAVLVRAGGAIYAVPSALVEQVRQLKEPELQGLREQGTATWQERQYPFRYLPRLLGDGAFVPEPRRLTPVLYVRSGAHCVALQLDEVIGNQEIVVKNAGPLLSRIAGITGATVLGSGRIVLILNPVILADRVPAATLAPAAAPVEPEPALPTVMVVDDSLTVRKITGRLLAREGYHVVTAKDGVDAMEQLQDLVPDAMLVDIEMPRMDGFDLTRNVRNDRRLKQVPIVMITSRTAEKHRTTAKEIGVDVFLGKPYQEEELLGHIAGFVRKPVAA
jgi:chemosensory pili system protein ChpA (sensor histidine kinase/response regulator)